MDDVRPHIAAGGVYVVPLRIGGGTRLKIFEAMAMGKAVVSTTIGAEGLPVTDGADIVHRRRARGVRARGRRADARRRGAARASRAAARQLVVERYDWSAVAGHFEDALTRVAQTATGARDPQRRLTRHRRQARTIATRWRDLGTMNVSVFGLGYVGSVSAASFAADGHTVVGVDVNPDKVASLNEGRSPIVEKGLDELIRDSAANGRLRATTSTDGGRRRDRPVAASASARRAARTAAST